MSAPPEKINNTGRGEKPARNKSSPPSAPPCSADQLKSAEKDLGIKFPESDDLILKCHFLKEQLKNCLQQFTEEEAKDLGYSKSDLDNALVIIYKEISSNGEYEEAHALASVILNRKDQTEQIFKTYPPGSVEDAKVNYNNTDKEYQNIKGSEKAFINDKLNKLSVKEKADLKAKYPKDSLWDTIKKEYYLPDYNEAQQARQQARNDLQQAKKQQDLVGGYVKIRKTGDSQWVTLTEIITAPGQFETYQNLPNKTLEEEFQEAYKKIQKEHEKNQMASCKRWQAAKNALQDVIQNPTQRQCYEFFVSVTYAKKYGITGGKQIGGNYFWYRNDQKQCPER